MNKYFKIIDHKFPEVGHTYMDSDRDFGRIEKKLRKVDSIYTPDQYRDVIRSSGKNNKIIDMAQHFRKFDELPGKLNIFKVVDC